jgi:hypothetical protein
MKKEFTPEEIEQREALKKEYKKRYYIAKKNGDPLPGRLFPTLTPEERKERQLQSKRTYNKKYYSEHSKSETWRNMMNEKSKASSKKRYARMKEERQKLKEYEERFGPLEDTAIEA